MGARPEANTLLCTRGPPLAAFPPSFQDRSAEFRVDHHLLIECACTYMLNTKAGTPAGRIFRMRPVPAAAPATSPGFLQRVSESLRANAETLYPPSRYARVAPRIAGVVREVKAVLGQQVEAGTPLAVIESAELGTPRRTASRPSPSSGSGKRPTSRRNFSPRRRSRPGGSSSRPKPNSRKRRSPCAAPPRGSSCSESPKNG